MLELVGVHDDLAPPPGHDAPAAVVLVVELVDLESQHGAAGLAAEQAVGRGPQHDRVLDHRVVDGDDVRPVGGAGGDASDQSGAQQLLALRRTQVERLVHRGHLPDLSVLVVVHAAASAGERSGPMVPKYGPSATAVVDRAAGVLSRALGHPRVRSEGGSDVHH